MATHAKSVVRRRVPPLSEAAIAQSAAQLSTLKCSNIRSMVAMNGNLILVPLQRFLPRFDAFLPRLP